MDKSTGFKTKPRIAVAQSCSIRSARNTASSSAPMAITSTRRPLAFNPPFPERGIVRPWAILGQRKGYLTVVRSRAEGS